ncbi:MAG: hydroxymethylglutaryl-CoA lyase, partial [Bdellovibrionales bacterium]|nr:hydroxymethylglutaryl-CoA lyase [Bdellovibrionales bacterium]
MKVNIVEVGPRDGLQNEKMQTTVETRYEFIKRLSSCGFKNIEIGSFVSEKWVPQMKGTLELTNRILSDQKAKKLPKDIVYSTLVPNKRGMDEAIKTDVTEIAFFTAASESFAKNNINCTIEESFERAAEVMAEIKKLQPRKIRVRGYISTAFYCPFEGKIKPKAAYKVAERLAKMGCYEISIGDTIGAATPIEVRKFLKNLPVSTKKVAMHFHDTRGTALANIAESLEHGIRVFDSSLGGLGGCPYAPGAAGNVATEDVVYMLEGMGIDTGLKLNKLIETNHWMAK